MSADASPSTYDYPDLRPRKFTGAAIEVDPESEAAVARMPHHIAYGPHGFGHLLNRLRRSEYISGPELADMIAVNKGLLIPPAIRHYLEAFLRGEVQVQRGRKGRTDEDAELVRWALEHLERHQLRLRERIDALATKKLTRREEALRDRYGPKGTPYDRTIRILHRVYFPHLKTVGAVKTLLSDSSKRYSSKKRPKPED